MAREPMWTVRLLAAGTLGLLTGCSALVASQLNEDSSGGAEVCVNGSDDDGDGLTDCMDNECARECGGCAAFFPSDSPDPWVQCASCGCQACEAKVLDCLSDDACLAAFEECLPDPFDPEAIGRTAGCIDLGVLTTELRMGRAFCRNLDPITEQLVLEAWQCVCNQFAGPTPACGPPEACVETPVPGGMEAGCGPDPEACCSDENDNDGNGMVDCADPSCIGTMVCGVGGMGAGCGPWLDASDVSGSIPAQADCQCDRCQGRWRDCLNGPNGRPEGGGGDDVPAELCLAAALCRGPWTNAATPSPVWGCGTPDSRVATPGRFAPVYCPSDLPSLRSVAVDLASEAMSGTNPIAQWLVGIGPRMEDQQRSMGYDLADCLCTAGRPGGSCPSGS